MCFLGYLLLKKLVRAPLLTVIYVHAHLDIDSVCCDRDLLLKQELWKAGGIDN